MRTEFEFVLPRGYVDEAGTVHKRGVMRLATARDELQPLREPGISGPDDPRLTLLVLTRVITKLGSLPMITVNEVEGLFAADLAYLQDFYGVINFGTEEEIDAMLAAQADRERNARSRHPGEAGPGGAGDVEGVGSAAPPAPSEGAGAPSAGDRVDPPAEARLLSRRAAVEEVPSGNR